VCVCVCLCSKNRRLIGSNLATRANLQEVKQLQQCPVQLTLYCTGVQYLLLYRHASIEEQMFRNMCCNRVIVSPRSD